MSERWTNGLFVLLVLLQLLLLSAQQEARGGRVEQALLVGLAPIAHAATQTYRGTENFFASFRTRDSLQAQNHELSQRLEAAQRELTRLRGVERELERLGEVVQHSRRGIGTALVADVVINDPYSWLRSLTLYTGSAEVRRNQPVVTMDGLVGRVVMSAGHFAKVLLVTDRASGVSAMLERTRRKGMIHGAGGNDLELEYMLLQDDVRIGDLVVTAGLDGIFPRDIPIGRVRSIEPGQGLFHRVRVSPAVDFWDLDQVDLLDLAEVPEELREEGDDGLP